MKWSTNENFNTQLNKNKILQEHAKLELYIAWEGPVGD